MTTQSFLLLLALSYMVLLVSIAWWAERRTGWFSRLHPYIYSLTLAVYCSSWTYFGAVGTAAQHTWEYMPIYLAPALLFVFGMGFLQKLVWTGARHKTTSIADFIGTRYGKRQILAGCVALVAVIGSLPYIALQLKAVSLAMDTLGTPIDSDAIAGYEFDSVMMVALLLALFSMIFGTRHVEGRERNRGMMSALAFESVVKLFALLAVAGLALMIAFDVNSNPAGIQAIVESNYSAWADTPFNSRYVTMGLLALLAIICLPRQFHVMVVEYQDRRDLTKSRWLFPLYLLLIMLVVLPITFVAQHYFLGSDVSAETFVLRLPMDSGFPLLSQLAFIGGFSAASGMVIVAVVTLSVMISNEILVPLLLRWCSRWFRPESLGRNLRWIRRICILAMMWGGWAVNQLIIRNESLAGIGLVSFACFAQLAPALVAGIYWRRIHARGIYVGLVVGLLAWFYCLLWPLLLADNSPILSDGPAGISWLRPQALLGVDFLDPLSHGVLWSLLPNMLFMVLVSYGSRPGEQDITQADAFVGLDFQPGQSQQPLALSSIQTGRLRLVIDPFLSAEQRHQLWRDCEEQARQRLLDDDWAPEFVVNRVEQSLAGFIGAASARSTIKRLASAKQLQLRDIAALVGGASQQLQFSRELLQTTVETVTQGIMVVDSELRVVAWNHRYQELFDYPPRLLYVGCPIREVYRYNAERGLLGNGGNTPAEIDKRLEQLRAGSTHRSERTLPSGITLQVVGNPMPNGGYVTTYTDISDYQLVLNELEKAKENLEERIAERTLELHQVHVSKTRFMQATCHDLLQPISSARLFLDVFKNQPDKTDSGEVEQQLGYIDKSLTAAENLIAALREISRLDSGKLVPQFCNFNIGELLEELAVEFRLVAETKGIALHSVPCSVWVWSDRHLLRRILQNFLSNAIHYTRRGRVLLGCRRVNRQLRVEVWDTGPGIGSDAMEKIFEEFERLSPGARGVDKGLGLGLTIARRMAKLLQHRIQVQSEPGNGSVFSVELNRGEVGEGAVDVPSENQQAVNLQGLRVFCVDNEEDILRGMQSLLQQWGCQVSCAQNRTEVEQLVALQQPPHVWLLDYHLEQRLNGVELLSQLPQPYSDVPVIVISADASEQVANKVTAAGYQQMFKPVDTKRLAAILQTIKGDKT
ncbi:PAS domain-containing hybrid sensor histidine kinase/response regulator [Porticoccus sp. W117]|uniref:PAS domain-containing hybrid sensor histidine kinase/response regulator n=1 Tax=Porticoccus sp. W117 TaxID=3054777 RepID=UPI002592D983|nr:PAS domain-containing hybrid sensor histidine kinase/response regulator [Porticoccus sp. W117]MDM3869923.1 PAS domain-containing hybrid sensor histidine kinase/response regulator [Porticoccus sp. W117]